MRIIFISDIFGKVGRKALMRMLPGLKSGQRADFVVANGENAASGAGITAKIAETLLNGGVDVITTGNHVWRQRDIAAFLDASDRIIRPANYLDSNPGRGWTVVEKEGASLAVVNLAGNLFMNPANGAFQVIGKVLEELPAGIGHILVDFHAEATSEKVAMGYLLDGKVTAVIGTHTHVQTADEKVLPLGTAYITDAGFTGPQNSVIGVDRNIILRRFTTQMPVKFEVADEAACVEGVVVEADENGRALSIERLRVCED
ncbi:MAG: TIGR00282 family metallophosphoesterase [Thermoleophilia bacterium]